MLKFIHLTLIVDRLRLMVPFTMCEVDLLTKRLTSP